MAGTRNALIVASYDYTDPGLRQLHAPASDARALEAVLQDPGIGGFDVRTLLNAPTHEINLAVEEFFADRRPDDLLLVHFSCHGVKDEDGDLYFATSNTMLRRLGATAVGADFVNRCMGRSRSRRIVLLLDCCYAGAFERGMTARAGTEVGIEAQLGGRGRAVITASSAMEYAFEGEQLADVGEPEPSVFTSALVTGLETGEADRDQDGLVALDELYDYIYDAVRATTPNQTPGKWMFGVQGEMVIARRSRPVSTPAELPRELQEVIDSPLASVRAAAVQELTRLLTGRHAGLALAARLALGRLTNDDSRTVAAAAMAALDTQASSPDAVPASPDALPAVAPPPEEATAPAPAESRAAPAPLELEAETPAPAVPQSDTPRTAGPTTTARRGPGPAERADPLRLAAGALAIVAAVAAVAGLFPYYQSGSSSFALATYYWSTWSVLLGAVVDVVAGTCLIVPGTRRLIGPGILLGNVAVSSGGLAYLIIFGLKYSDLAGGFWLQVAAGLAEVTAACLAGIAVARTGEVGFSRWPSRARLSWAIVLIGAVAAVTMILHSLNLVAQGQPGEYLAWSVWTAVMALAVPVFALVVTPARFAVAILFGWLAADVAFFVYHYFFWNYQHTNGYTPLSTAPLMVFGVAVAVLIGTAALFARGALSAGTQGQS